MTWPKRVSVSSTLLKQLSLQQEALRARIIQQPLPDSITTIAGCDSALSGDQIFSVFVIFEYPSLREIEIQTSYSLLDFPYIPGFLAFREIPNLLKAYAKLQIKPDVIMVDGSAMMHPRRMGIATHLGVILDIPTLGVAKKKLVGTYEEPGKDKSSYTPVWHKDEQVAVALRSKEKVKPIFVSPGHLCDMKSAVGLTLLTLKKHKLPEPTRLADLYSKTLKEKVA